MVVVITDGGHNATATTTTGLLSVVALLHSPTACQSIRVHVGSIKAETK